MRIEYRQSGGLGGLRISAACDTATLKKADRQRVEAWAAALLAAPAGRSPKARDAILYDFTIDGDPYQFDDTTLPDEGEELSQFLREHLGD